MRRHLKCEEFERLCWELSRIVVDSGWQPTHLLTPVRGGPPVANFVHEYLRFRGIHPKYMVVDTNGYNDTQQLETVEISGVDLLPGMTSADRLLLVDDIFDTGRSVDALVSSLEERYSCDMPETRVASVFYKPTSREVDIEPDFFVEKTDKWIVFRHELMIDGQTSYPLDELLEMKGNGFY